MPIKNCFKQLININHEYNFDRNIHLLDRRLPLTLPGYDRKVQMNQTTNQIQVSGISRLVAIGCRYWFINNEPGFRDHHILDTDIKGLKFRHENEASQPGIST